MSSVWLAMLLLLVLAIVFVAWPVWRYRSTNAVGHSVSEDEVSTRLAENVKIFREHLLELESNLSASVISVEQFEQLKLELQRNLLDDEAAIRGHMNANKNGIGWGFIVLFAVVVFGAGVIFYAKKGASADIHVQSLLQAKMQSDYQDMVQNRQPDPARAKELIELYQERLSQKPDNYQYWFLLARSQMEINDYAAAAKSYQELLQRDPQSPMVMAELAQAMFLRDGNKMSPPVTDLAKSAVQLDPKNTMALGLLGIDAFGQKNYRSAIQYWQKSVDLLGVESEGAQALMAGIAKAKQEFANAGGKLEELTAKSPYALVIQVALDSKVNVSPDAVVFVYARAWKGSPMPLAISRFKAAELPKTITLDETMAMSPAASLATAKAVEVVARISPEGSAAAKVGDWQAKRGPIDMQAVPKEIQLNVTERITEASLKIQ